MSLFKQLHIFSSKTPLALQFQQVRFRYFAEKIEKGPIIRRYGLKEKILQRGLLPRLDCGRKLPIPAYR